MSLEDQIRWLDLALRSAATGSTETLPERPADDEAILVATDPARLNAFGHYLADKITGRWWLERFPATLTGIALTIGGPGSSLTTAAYEVLPTDWFERADGEDVQGTALLGWLCADERTPDWLRDVAAYEYLVHCGLPREVDGLPRDAELEAALLPELIRIEPISPIAPDSSDSAAELPGQPGERVQLSGPVLFASFSMPVGEVCECLENGEDFSDLIGLTRSAALAVRESGLTEIDGDWPNGDLLQLCARPQTAASLAAMLGMEEEDVAELVQSFVELELLERC